MRYKVMLSFNKHEYIPDRKHEFIKEEDELQKIIGRFTLSHGAPIEYPAQKGVRMLGFIKGLAEVSILFSPTDEKAVSSKVVESPPPPPPPQPEVIESMLKAGVIK